MSKYIVIPISISIKNKKFAHSGDVIDESQLNSPTHDLVKDGFIRLATEEEIEASGQVQEEEEFIEDDDSDENVEEDDDDVTDESQVENTEAPSISTKDQIKNSFKKKQ